MNIDRKAYWFDETFTSLRVSGYTEYEFVEQVSQAGLISQQELEKCQRINKAWAFNLSRMFIDSNHSRIPIYFGFENSFTILIEMVLVCLIVILSIYSLYFICRRYIIPAHLFIQISIAHVSAESIIGKSYRGKIAKIIICLILSGSIISCITISQASSWWTKSDGYDYFAAAKLINIVILVVLLLL